MKPDLIKRCALCKLREYVKSGIEELKEGMLPLSFFKFDPLEGSFSEEELKEIRRIIERIQTKEGLVDYCLFNDIDLSSFKK